MESKRILIVDDQESMRDMLFDLVDMMGHEAHTVESGADALVARSSVAAAAGSIARW